MKYGHREAEGIIYSGKHRDAEHRKKPRRLLRTIALATAVLMLALVTAGYAVYHHLNGNLTTFDMSALTNRPGEVVDNSKPHHPMNILLLGSDTRQGQTKVLGSTPGLSDTTILLHVSADRKRAYGVSIPRDLMVRRPDCQNKHGGGLVRGGLDLWNAAYAYGGAVCTVKQFEAMTHIRVNHTIVVDFNGFKGMVDALGGVKICVPKQIDDEIGRIHLPAGTYKVNGAQALDYVRVRHVISENGDIGRMRRQQAFLAAMTNEAVSAGTLANPVKLYKFLDAATKSITTDDGLGSLNKLVGLANQLKSIGLSNIQFLTMPIATYVPDPNRLAAGPGSKDLWNRLRHDRVLTKAQKSSATSAANKKGKKKAAARTDAEQNGLCA